MRLRSVTVISHGWAGWERLKPQLRHGLGSCRAAAGGIARRLAGIDIVPSLIAAIDGIEAVLRWIARLARRGLPRRGVGLANTRAWRGVAALSGVGLAVALITGLSAKDEDKLTLASLASAAANFPMQESAVPRRSHVPGAAGEWIAIPQPAALFSLEAPELGREPSSLEARRSLDGSRREDLLSFGSLTAPTPHLLLRLATGEGAAAGARSFMVALVHEAAQRSLAVERSSTPAPLETRFGPLETADVQLGDGKESRSCIAFRTPPGEADFGLSGWWCSAPKPGDRHQLACLVERLGLAGAADPELRGLFARAALESRSGCAPSQASALYPDGTMPAPRVKTAGAEITQIPPERRKSRPKPARRQP